MNWGYILEKFVNTKPMFIKRIVVISVLIEIVKSNKMLKKG
jgi:F0F1-type ATP synthase assembly protein I